MTCGSDKGIGGAQVDFNVDIVVGDEGGELFSADERACVANLIANNPSINT